MSYYYFNRCPERCLPEIEKLADELGFVELECSSSARSWKGDVLKRRKKFDRMVDLVYNPNSKRPFVMQTSNPVTHKQKDVLAVIRKFIDIAKPTEIYDSYSPYDMNEFRV